MSRPSIPHPLLLVAVIVCIARVADAFTPPSSPALIGLRSSTAASRPLSPSSPLRPKLHQRPRRSALASSSASAPGGGAQESSPPSPIEPTTFREGEVMGLRLMQDGRHEDALKAFKKAMTLPGSRPDIVRTANVPGPSPVGGSRGGTEARAIQGLDEFEYQAAHYNMACAHASLGNAGESIANIRKAFEYGFDNYATVRADPDLGYIRGTAEFDRLMEEFDPRGFNPFKVFGK